jgi:hypothetical protein
VLRILQDAASAETETDPSQPPHKRSEKPRKPPPVTPANRDPDRSGASLTRPVAATCCSPVSLLLPEADISGRPSTCLTKAAELHATGRTAVLTTTPSAMTAEPLATTSLTSTNTSPAPPSTSNDATNQQTVSHYHGGVVSHAHFAGQRPDIAVTWGFWVLWWACSGLPSWPAGEAWAACRDGCQYAVDAMGTGHWWALPL